jgi:hypothetical protein
LFSKTKRRSVYGVMMPDSYKNWSASKYLENKNKGEDG